MVDQESARQAHKRGTMISNHEDTKSRSVNYDENLHRNNAAEWIIYYFVRAARRAKLSVLFVTSCLRGSKFLLQTENPGMAIPGLAIVREFEVRYRSSGDSIGSMPTEPFEASIDTSHYFGSIFTATPCRDTLRYRQYVASPSNVWW